MPGMPGIPGMPGMPGVPGVPAMHTMPGAVMPMAPMAAIVGNTMVGTPAAAAAMGTTGAEQPFQTNRSLQVGVTDAPLRL